MEFTKEEVEFYLDDLKDMLAEVQEMEPEVREELSAVESAIKSTYEKLQNIDSLSDDEKVSLSDELDRLSEVFEDVEDEFYFEDDEDEDDGFEDDEELDLLSEGEIDPEELKNMTEQLAQLFDMMKDAPEGGLDGVGDLKDTLQQVISGLSSPETMDENALENLEKKIDALEKDSKA